MSQSMAHSMKRFQGMCDSLEGKKPVYMHQRMPPPPLCSLGRHENRFRWKSWGMKRRTRQMGWWCSGTHCHQVECLLVLRADNPDMYAPSLSLSFSPSPSLSISIWHAYISIQSPHTLALNAFAPHLPVWGSKDALTCGSIDL